MSTIFPPCVTMNSAVHCAFSISIETDGLGTGINVALLPVWSSREPIQGKRSRDDSSPTGRRKQRMFTLMPVRRERPIVGPRFRPGYYSFKAEAPYDVNAMATRQELRSFVCGQCHVEYYFKGEGKLLTYPWRNGLKVEQIEAYYNETGFRDWVHAETKAPVLKAQHPEFEIWNQGIHARSGVACADCHMPYRREGAIKISDHQVRSPMFNIARACQTCHRYPEDEIKARVEAIQGRTKALQDRAEDA